MRVYKGIKFAEGMNVSLAEFKNMFSSNKVFKDTPHLSLEDEFKKAYKIATNGNITSAESKSKKADDEKSDRPNI